jgi:PadR family transcriptional regulator, regulatory protein PadR
VRRSHQLRLVAQALIDIQGQETNGFELSKVTGLKPGSLYPMLQRLVDEKWVTFRWEDIDESAEQRRRRRYYRLTGLGEREARALIAHDARALRQLMPGWV